MDALVELLAKFLTEPFTRRRLIPLFLLVSFAVFGLYFYERYTLSFHLSRLQKEAELLIKLQEIESQGTNRTPELERSQKALRSQIAQAIETKPVSVEFTPATLTFSMDSVWKFVAGSAIWVIFATFPLRKWKTRSGRQDILGGFAVASLAGFLAVFVPPIWWPWFHILVFPFVFSAAVVIAVSPIAFLLLLRRARNRAQTVHCLNNLKQVGIAARIWSGDHGDALPKDFDSMKKEMGDERITVCPADRRTKYEILSPGISETDPSAVYARWVQLNQNNMFTDRCAGGPETPPLSSGSLTWDIPSRWQITGSGLTNAMNGWNQVFTLDASSTERITKFNRWVARSTNNIITTH